jgi:hypothetical protein
MHEKLADISISLKNLKESSFASGDIFGSSKVCLRASLIKPYT